VRWNGLPSWAVDVGLLAAVTVTLAGPPLWHLWQAQPAASPVWRIQPMSEPLLSSAAETEASMTEAEASTSTTLDEQDNDIPAHHKKKKPKKKRTKKPKKPKKPKAPHVKKEPPTLKGPLDLNTAPLAQLELLPGVGPVMAQRMVDYRKAHGGFKTVDDLDEVSGIGKKTLEKLRPWVRVSVADDREAIGKS
jgi:competence ComEA-like helix-hairpin-helix protein